MLKKLADFYLSIDLRSLGLFRIAIALVLIWDWLARWPHLEAFYTSFGVLPMEAVWPRVGGQFHYSLLDGAHSLVTVRILFVLGLFCYLLFLIGYRTKLAHILSFIFFISVCNRNMLIRFGGDIVMGTMLMWGLFLPLGARFSIDSFRRLLRSPSDLRAHGPVAEEAARSIRSLAAFAIVFQIALIYALTSLDKFGTTWRDGTAVYYALSSDRWCRPLGEWVRAQPLWAIKFLTWGALAIEYAAALLILVPLAQPFMRRVAILSLTALHVGIWSCMMLGTFQATMIAAHALLLLPQDWALLSKWTRRLCPPVTVYYDAGCGFCRRFCEIAAGLDRAGRISFRANSEPARSDHRLSARDIRESIIVFTTTGQKLTRAAAISAIVRALPLAFHPLRSLALPGLRTPSDAIYSYIAAHRGSISRSLGLDVCAVGSSSTPSQGQNQGRAECPVSKFGAAASRLLANLATGVLFVALSISAYNRNLADEKEDEVTPGSFLSAVVQYPQLGQGWNLFAPNPPQSEGWWVVLGTTETGELIDPLTNQPPQWEKPDDLNRYDRFWRKYLGRLSEKKYTRYRAMFVDYLERKNRRESPPGKRLIEMDFFFCRQKTPPPGRLPDNERVEVAVERSRLMQRECRIHGNVTQAAARDAPRKVLSTPKLTVDDQLLESLGAR